MAVDYTPVNTAVQALIDKAVADKGAVDAAALQAALAADAVTDAAALKAKDDALAAKQAELDAYKLAHPDKPAGDTTAPTITTGLMATAVSASQINLVWAASTDAVGVTSYLVFRNGVQVGTATATNYADTGLTASTPYSYTVRARDAAGNTSADSAKATATTQAIPVPPTGDFVWKGLQTPQLTKEWMLANTGPRIPTVASTATSVSGTVSGKKFSKTVIPAAGTVFVDCEFAFSGWGIDGDGKGKFTVDRCRFKGTGGFAAILGNATVTACDISGVEDGIKPQGGGGAIRANYIHDLAAGSTAHNDGIQVFEGPWLIEQNYIDSRDTSAVMVQSWTNSASDAPGGVIVRHNWLGGADLPLRIESECKGKGCGAYENVIKHGYWGWADLEGADVQYGNILIP